MFVKQTNVKLEIEFHSHVGVFHLPVNISHFSVRPSGQLSKGCTSYSQDLPNKPVNPILVFA